MGLNSNGRRSQIAKDGALARRLDVPFVCERPGHECRSGKKQSNLHPNQCVRRWIHRFPGVLELPLRNLPAIRTDEHGTLDVSGDAGVSPDDGIFGFLRE